MFKKIFFLLVLTVFAAGMVHGDELDRSVLKDEWRDLVLSEINWDYPGLESAKKCFLAGDKKGASTEFVKYLRNKKQPQVMSERIRHAGTRNKANQGLNYIWTYGANSHKFPNRRNKREGQQEADYFRVSAWRQLGENCGKYLAKGRKVCVIGPVSVRTYQASDGTTKASLEVTADDVEFLSPKGEQTDPQTGYEVVAPDDLPY